MCLVFLERSAFWTHSMGPSLRTQSKKNLFSCWRISFYGGAVIAILWISNAADLGTPYFLIYYFFWFLFFRLRMLIWSCFSGFYFFI